MFTFAIIEDGKVMNTILADSKTTAEKVTGKFCVQFTEENPACIGYGFDGTTFEQPPIIEQILDYPQEEISESAKV